MATISTVLAVIILIGVVVRIITSQLAKAHHENGDME